MNTPSPSAGADRWHILGAGAIGGLQAHRLSARGLAVVLVGRDTAPARTLVLEEGEALCARTFDQRTAGATGPIRQLLVTTKGPATAGALEPLANDLAPGACVVLLQNGMGSEARLAAMRPDLQLLVAITTDGVFRRARDHLVLAGHGDTWLGALRPQDEALAATVATTLGMGFATDIRARRWRKLALNCAINPLTALRRCRNGELLDSPEALATMRAACAEVAAVMRAEGEPAEGEALFAEACAVARATAANLSSMRIDADAGRPTEIAFLNGYVVARGRALGLATPVNAALVAAVEGLS